MHFIVTLLLFSCFPKSMIFCCLSGPVSGCLHRSHWHVCGWAVPEHHTGHQLFGLSAEEELAERESSLHQDHYGPCWEDLLRIWIKGIKISFFVILEYLSIKKKSFRVGDNLSNRTYLACQSPRLLKLTIPWSLEINIQCLQIGYHISWFS